MNKQFFIIMGVLIAALISVQSPSNAARNMQPGASISTERMRESVLRRAYGTQNMNYVQDTEARTGYMKPSFAKVQRTVQVPNVSGNIRRSNSRVWLTRAANENGFEAVTENGFTVNLPNTMAAAGVTYSTKVMPQFCAGQGFAGCVRSAERQLNAELPHDGIRTGGRNVGFGYHLKNQQGVQSTRAQSAVEAWDGAARATSKTVLRHMVAAPDGTLYVLETTASTAKKVRHAELSHTMFRSLQIL